MSGEAEVRRALERGLPRILPSSRWFGDKGRPIRGATVHDLARDGTGEGGYAFAVVDVGFVDGGVARYFVPVAVLPATPAGILAIAELDGGGRSGVVVEAFAAPGFAASLIDLLAREAELRGERGWFRWEHLPGAEGRLAAARGAAGRLGTAEQSNTSIGYGEAVFLKVFRRLREGVNPDEEIGRFLATRTTFRRLPLPLGTGAYVDGEGATYSLGLAQDYVRSVGDGWSFTLEALARLGRDGEPAGRIADLVGAARLLGERTGELHLALASDPDDTAFAPEPVAAGNVEAWEAGTIASLRAAAAELRGRVDALEPELRPWVGELARRLPALERRARGFRSLLGAAKLRVHGDYHLGQVLRTPDGDWTIIDFEGEPARPLEERRAKTSALKDVAGMLRSFGYARSAAVRAAGDRADRETIVAGASAWEGGARAAFLAGYRSVTAGRAARLFPVDDEAFAAALAAWELDKAVYELGYEMRNRPDWLGHALGTLLGGAGGGHGDAGR